jgi:membrane associated rhomboid family serine protease
MIPIRDENPAQTAPVITVGIIIGCIGVFLWQQSLGPQGFEAAIYSFGMIPAVVFHHGQLQPDLVVIPATATLVTSMFMHSGWMHLLGNMLYLWIFGNNVEDCMGHNRYTVFYLLCGLLAALSQALVNSDSQIPMIGASGAISGVLGAYMMLYPRAQVLVFIPFGILSQLTRLPALWVLGFWFVMQLLSSTASQPGQGGVAFLAHAGGFIAGMLLVRMFKRADVPLNGDVRF